VRRPLNGEDQALRGAKSRKKKMQRMLMRLEKMVLRRKVKVPMWR